jgi:hypothetical protein
MPVAHNPVVSSHYAQWHHGAVIAGQLSGIVWSGLFRGATVLG